MDIFLL